MIPAPDDPIPSTRTNWPVRILAAGEQSTDDLSASSTAEERLEMVWVLSRRMWELTGHRSPALARENIPIRILRLA